MPKRKQSPAQLANLIPITKSTARELGRKGAMVSNKVQAEKRSIRQWLEMMGAMKANPEIAAKMQKMFPEIKVAQFTNNAAMAARMFNDAIIKGDARAQSNIADITGERAAQKHEIISQQTIDIKSVKNLKKLLDD